jgi:hypothetical protein
MASAHCQRGARRTHKRLRRSVEALDSTLVEVQPLRSLSLDDMYNHCLQWIRIRIRAMPWHCATYMALHGIAVPHHDQSTSDSDSPAEVPAAGPGLRVTVTVSVTVTEHLASCAQPLAQPGHFRNQLLSETQSVRDCHIVTRVRHGQPSLHIS